MGEERNREIERNGMKRERGRCSPQVASELQAVAGDVHVQVRAGEGGRTHLSTHIDRGGVHHAGHEEQRSINDFEYEL